MKKLKPVAAFLILALTAVAAVIACRPGPSDHKLGGPIDYAPSGAAPFTAFCQVPTPCLGNLQTVGMGPGSQAFVYSTKSWYYLDPSSTAVPDNSGTFAAKNGTGTLGNWVILPGVSSAGGGMQDGSASEAGTYIATSGAGAVLNAAQIANNLIILTGTVNASNFFLTLPNNVGQQWFIDVSGVTFGGKYIEVNVGSDAGGYAIIYNAGIDGGNTTVQQQKTMYEVTVSQPNVVVIN